jgi:hypothetical protein
MNKKLGEMSNFLVFNSGEETHPNSPRIIFPLVAAICPEMQFQQARSSSENRYD